MNLPKRSRARVAIERALLRATLRLPRPLLERIARKRLAPIDGRTLDLDAAVLLALDDVFNQGEVAGRTPADARLAMAEGAAVVDARPRIDVLVEPARVAGAMGPRTARLYVPRSLPAPSPLVVFFHGGGWVAGDLDTHDAWCRSLAARAKTRVLSVDYRLAPESRFPAAVLDACAAFRDAAARADLLGADRARIAVMGDSAGGNLSAVVAQRTAKDAIKPALQVLVYPALDATKSKPSHRTYAEGYFLTEASIDWYLANYATPDVDRANVDLSPFFREDVRGLPPALIYTAGFDPLRDEAAAYAERLRAAGVPVTYRELPTLVHGFCVMTDAIRAARVATDEISDAVGRALRAEEGRRVHAPA